MKIALIWPNGFDVKYVFPLSLGYLKSNIDGQKHEVKIFDFSMDNILADSEEFKRLISNFNPDLVAVSCWSTTYPEAINILENVKSHNPNILTVIGGAHVSCYFSETMRVKAVDFVISGEAEKSFPMLLDSLTIEQGDLSQVPGLIYRDDNNEIVKNSAKIIDNLDEIKPPDYNAIGLQRYIKSGYRLNTRHRKNAPIWVTRGCPYKCDFCSASILNGTQVRSHSISYIKNVIQELYYNHHIRHISIIDDNFTFHIEYAKEFCKVMKQLNLKGLTFGTPNGIRMERTDLELLRLMKEVGWENIVVAPESGSEKTLKRMKKKTNLSTISSKIDEIKSVGFKVHGFFIIGYPGETKEDIEKTIQLIRKCKLNFFFLNNFQPLPGTPIYQELVNNGEVLASHLPKNYSDGERSYTPQCLKDINFAKIILREYLYLALSNPFNVPYMIGLLNPYLIIKKISLNLINMLRKSFGYESTYIKK